MLISATMCMGSCKVIILVQRVNYQSRNAVALTRVILNQGDL